MSVWIAAQGFSSKEGGGEKRKEISKIKSNTFFPIYITSKILCKCKEGGGKAKKLVR